MGEELRNRRLVDQPASRGQDPGDLCECTLRLRDVVAGPEVEHDIEGSVGEGQVPHIALEQLRRDAARIQVSPGALQQTAVHVETHEASRLTTHGQGDEGVRPSAAHLEDPLAARDTEAVNDPRDLHPRLQPVPSGQHGERDVVQDGRGNGEARRRGDGRRVAREGCALHGRPPSCRGSDATLTHH